MSAFAYMNKLGNQSMRGIRIWHHPYFW